MKKKLHTILAAACLSLMLAPAMAMAADDTAAPPAGNGQTAGQAAGANDQSGSDQSAMPEDGMGSEEAAPSDAAPDEGASPEDSAPEDGPSAD